MSNTTQSSQYNEKFITALQWMWGDGFLSPGGAEDVAELVSLVDTKDKKVLEIGCGLGASAVLLADKYGAASVHGIDIEPHLIDHCRQRASKAGLDDRVSFQLVEPGPLQFDDESFDMVFTKDAIVHIADKQALYKDILRILKPGGSFVGSDWLRGGEGEISAVAAEWLKLVHLDMQMINLEQTKMALEMSGFHRVNMNDRNAWYCEEIKLEMMTLKGEKFAELARRIGQDEAEYRLKNSALKQKVINEGFLRPTHFVGYKPS